MKKYWEVKMKADRVGELLLYGPISNDQFWGDEVTPKQIDADIKTLGDLDVLNVRINSPGGSVSAGQAIYALLKRNTTPTKCAYIDGLAASTASIVPLGCDHIIMAGNALQMIHRPYMTVTGNADFLQERTALLLKNEDIIIDIYAEKTSLPRDKIKEMMNAETWMNAKEALELGFIDEIENEIQVAASIDGDLFVCGDVKVDMKTYKNPARIKEMYRETDHNPPEPVADNNSNDDPNADPDPLPDILAAQDAEFRRIRNKIYQYKEDL